MTKQLSPVAQSIYNAAHAADSAPFSSSADVIAAALRAINDYVVLPKYQYTVWELANAIHQEIEAIADELEAL